MSAPLPPARLTVLVDEDVSSEEFASAIAALQGRFTAPSGRHYVLDLAGRRLQVDLVVDAFAVSPPGDEIDADLFALAGQLMDTVGGDWSSDGLRRTAEVWGWVP